MSASDEPRPRRAARAVLAAAAVLALLTLVAVVSSARGPGGDGAGGRAPPPVFFDYLFSAAMALVLLSVPVWAWLFFSQYGRREPGAGKRRDLVTLAVVALVCGVIALLAERTAGEQVGRYGQTAPAATAAPTAQAPTTPTARPRDAEFRWEPFAVVAAGVAAAIAFLAFRQRRALAEEIAGELLAGDLAGLLDETLDDLRAEPDPRRAVVAAYARMERALARFGLPREPAEAPIEYLERIADDLAGVPGAPQLVFELTHLYERAKFSPHAIDPEMKDEAIATLAALRGELRELAP